MFALLLLLLERFVSSAAKVVWHPGDDGHGCESQDDTLSTAREEYVKRLDGKRVVFLGDSVTRCEIEANQYIFRICSAFESDGCQGQYAATVFHF